MEDNRKNELREESGDEAKEKDMEQRGPEISIPRMRRAEELPGCQLLRCGGLVWEVIGIMDLIFPVLLIAETALQMVRGENMDAFLKTVDMTVWGYWGLMLGKLLMAVLIWQAGRFGRKSCNRADRAKKAFVLGLILFIYSLYQFAVYAVNLYVYKAGLIEIGMSAAMAAAAFAYLLGAKKNRR